MASDEDIPQEIVDRMMVKCGRCCCICRQFKPTKLQVHHIIERAKGGDNNEDNLIVTCLSCHTDIHTKVPFARRFSVDEQKGHRNEVVRLVNDGTLPGVVNESFAIGRPAISVHFFDQRTQSISGSLELAAERCHFPNQIPDFCEAGSHLRSHIESVNSGYYRELAAYEAARRLFRGVQIAVTNGGSATARDIRIDLSISHSVGRFLHELPKAPRQRSSYIMDSVRRSAIDVAMLNAGQQDFEIGETGNRSYLRINYESLHPDEQVLTPHFWMAILDPGEHRLSGTAYAADMPSQAIALKVESQIRVMQISFERLREMPPPIDEGEDE